MTGSPCGAQAEIPDTNLIWSLIYYPSNGPFLSTLQFPLLSTSELNLRMVMKQVMNAGIAPAFLLGIILLL